MAPNVHIPLQCTLYPAASRLLSEHRSNLLFFLGAHQWHPITCWIKSNFLWKMAFEALLPQQSSCLPLPPACSPEGLCSVSATHRTLSCLRASGAGTALFLHHLTLLPGFPSSSWIPCHLLPWLNLKVSAPYPPLSEVFPWLPVQRGSCSGILSPSWSLYQVLTLHSLGVLLFSMSLSRWTVSSTREELCLFVPFSTQNLTQGLEAQEEACGKNSTFYQVLKSYFLLKV